MTDFSAAIELPEDFDGQVRLFPLPGLVLFPHAMQPLHLFEPRYVAMLREALATDHLITMATLLDQPAKKVSPPAISKTVCVGRIISHSELDGDRHNILLVGARRATVRREFDSSGGFRKAQVDLIDDFYHPSATAQRAALKRRLLEVFGKLLPGGADTNNSLQDLMAGQMGVGPITDIIAYALPLDPEDKLRMLAMSDVDARAEALIELMQSGSVFFPPTETAEPTADLNHARRPPEAGFPPPFSVN